MTKERRNGKFIYAHKCQHQTVWFARLEILYMSAKSHNNDYCLAKISNFKNSSCRYISVKTFKNW